MLKAVVLCDILILESELYVVFNVHSKSRRTNAQTQVQNIGAEQFNVASWKSQRLFLLSQTKILFWGCSKRRGEKSVDQIVSIRSTSTGEKRGRDRSKGFELENTSVSQCCFCLYTMRRERSQGTKSSAESFSLW